MVNHNRVEHQDCPVEVFFDDRFVGIASASKSTEWLCNTYVNLVVLIPKDLHAHDQEYTQQTSPRNNIIEINHMVSNPMWLWKTASSFKQLYVAAWEGLSGCHDRCIIIYIRVSNVHINHQFYTQFDCRCITGKRLSAETEIQRIFGRLAHWRINDRLRRRLKLQNLEKVVAGFKRT